MSFPGEGLAKRTVLEHGDVSCKGPDRTSVQSPTAQVHDDHGYALRVPTVSIDQDLSSGSSAVGL